MAWIRLLVFIVSFTGSAVAYPMLSKPQETGVYGILNLQDNYVYEVEKLKAGACGNYFADLDRGGRKNIVFLIVNSVRKEGGVKEYLVTLIITHAAYIRRTIGLDVTTPNVVVEKIADEFFFNMTVNLEDYFGSPCFFTTTEFSPASQKTP